MVYILVVCCMFTCSVVYTLRVWAEDACNVTFSLLLRFRSFGVIEPRVIDHVLSEPECRRDGDCPLDKVCHSLHRPTRRLRPQCCLYTQLSPGHLQLSTRANGEPQHAVH